MTFKKWMLEVDNILCDKIGVFTDDIPDQQYRDEYDNRTTPKKMVDIIIENERYKELLEIM